MIVRLIPTVALVLGLLPRALAFEADGCEKQRADYPKRWNSVAGEKTLVTCTAIGKSEPKKLVVRRGARDAKGRTLISIEPVPRPKDGIYRIWLDREQAERLKKGEYFATILRMEDACWIRGISEDAEVFFMDNAALQGRDALAPRLSWFGKAAYRCAAGKPSEPVMSAKSCEQQRADFPKDWNDTAKDKSLFDCGFRGTYWRIKLGKPEASDRLMLSVVRLHYENQGSANQGTELVEIPDWGVYRAWLDNEQAKRLVEGRYFATAVQPEDSCLADGSLKDGSVFFLDAADPPQDRPDAGNLYNKAPRFGVFGEPMHCQAVSDKP